MYTSNGTPVQVAWPPAPMTDLHCACATGTTTAVPDRALGIQCLCKFTGRCRNCYCDCSQCDYDYLTNVVIFNAAAAAAGGSDV